MATTIQPTEFAREKGLEPADFSEACRNGETEYAGFPIGDWTVRDEGGGVYLRVPDSVVSQPQESSSNAGNRRSNPDGNALGLRTAQTTEMAEAVDNNAAPVSANLGASYAVGSLSEAVRENPEIIETIADVAALLGSGGLGLSATEEGEKYRFAKVGATALGGFGAYKLIRHLCEQNDRQTDMEERQQRHQIQQEKQTSKSLPRGRGDGVSRSRGDGRPSVNLSRRNRGTGKAR